MKTHQMMKTLLKTMAPQRKMTTLTTMSTTASKFHIWLCLLVSSCHLNAPLPSSPTFTPPLSASHLQNFLLLCSNYLAQLESNQLHFSSFSTISSYTVMISTHFAIQKAFPWEKKHHSHSLWIKVANTHEISVDLLTEVRRCKALPKSFTWIRYLIEN